MGFKTTRIARVWTLKRPFNGEPCADDFALTEEQLPPIEDGQLVCEAEYLSVDPYMRVKMASACGAFPAPMIGTQVAKVIESKHPSYPVGSHIYGHFGWRSHTLVKDPANKSSSQLSNSIYPCPKTDPHPRSLALGGLGRVGLSAYYGLLDVAAFKAGDIVLISGAAGAVGSLVGQIARICGASRVVGIAGSAEKCRWLCDELGFDAAVDYHGNDFAERLNAALPDGTDVYFDNVGGMVSWHAMHLMRMSGRIAVCGSIAAYNAADGEEVLVPQFNTFRRFFLRMEGFLVDRWTGDRWFEGLEKLREWLVAGKLKCRETVTVGFERMPEAFVEMMRGGNVGKAIVKV